MQGKDRLWHPFRRTGCGLKGTMAILTLISVVLVISILLKFEHTATAKEADNITHTPTPDDSSLQGLALQTTRRPKRHDTRDIPNVLALTQNKTRRQVNNCALAAAMVMVKQVQLPVGQNLTLTYDKPTDHDCITIQVTGQAEIQGLPYNKRCARKGHAIIVVNCLSDHCVNMDSDRIMEQKRAQKMIGIWPAKDKARGRQQLAQSQDKIQVDQLLAMSKQCTPCWQTNTFYCWLKYFAEQVSQETCITCYNMGRTPQVRPLPFTPQQCSGGRLKFAIINET